MQDGIRLAQLSDLHLTGNVGTHATYQSFLQVLSLAVADSPDFLLFTGDLVNDGTPHAYTWLIDTLTKTKIPFALLAGNHDVTLEIGKDLPFEARTFSPITPDDRLLINERFLLGTWQILCVHSAVAGCAYGYLDEQTLSWLDDTLYHHRQPALLAMHHHPMAVNSAWIDELMLDNADELWTILSQHSHIKVLLTGHVHQAHHQTKSFAKHDMMVLNCPATSRQFAPFASDFALDEQSAGYRLIQLYNTAHLETWIKRLDTSKL